MERPKILSRHVDLKRLQYMEQATAGNPVVAKLTEQLGVGTVTATVMRVVIGRFDRFGSGKQLSAA